MDILDKTIVFAKENKCINCLSDLYLCYINNANIFTINIYCDKCLFKIYFSMPGRLCISYKVNNSNFYVRTLHYYLEKSFSVYEYNNFTLRIKNVDYILSKQDIENYLILK